ncbi:hypothetical protein BKA82DRAFT_890638 [Pisolithus tinctorius]|uniref:Uncharacterized protein n=1 Tax=Pisolithus tinctorius Marx 270 TaxID=870435 RepID=A0A0C3N8Y9_PISTI|nr:hypothetical protein BKA82DRAFT_890638 [Pisolithus tinctorius]KIN97534.1 hypothetical protein M404DRAFT_890638 [Pisolithus tinctorius Marx 270]
MLLSNLGDPCGVPNAVQCMFKPKPRPCLLAVSSCVSSCLRRSLSVSLSNKEWGRRSRRGVFPQDRRRPIISNRDLLWDPLSSSFIGLHFLIEQIKIRLRQMYWRSSPPVNLCICSH